jgi:hypothetical protein
MMSAGRDFRMARYWAIIGVAAVEDMRRSLGGGIRGIKKAGGKVAGNRDIKSLMRPHW